MHERDAAHVGGHRLADRLAEAGRGHFVGRASELDLFRAALSETPAGVAVLHIYGPGGIGKTALLAQYALLARDAGRPTLQLDGRDVQASTHGITHALSRALGLADGTDPSQALGALDGLVLLIDTFEAIAPLDDWLRSGLFPLLPANSLTVIAGRNAPAEAWRSDPGWGALTRIVPLRNLGPEETRVLLSARGVASDQHEAILGYTYGQPLALCLAAEVALQGRTAVDLASAGVDVVQRLLERFVAGVPSERHRRALEASAIARRTTQPLLASALDVGDAVAFGLFAWLLGLPFIERDAHGLFPHDLVREVIFEDLRWRHPDLLRQLVRRISAAEAGRFFAHRGYEQHQALWALLFVTRHHPSMRPFYDWTGLGDNYAEEARPADRAAIVAMVERHEGPASARIASYWFDRRPQWFSVLRSVGGELTGFVANLVLACADEDAAAVDPAVGALWTYIERHGPLRPGEQFSVVRFWMDREGYQNPTAFNMGATLSTSSWMTEARLAWSFVVLREPEFWLPMFRYVNFQGAEGADIAVGGHRYGSVAHDWRAEPPMVWWREMVERREAFLVSRDAPKPPETAPVVVLSEQAFRDAVRRALRDYARPDALAANPLMRSRLVVESGGEAAAPAELQARLRAAVESLNTHPRDQKLYRAVWHTYIEPAPTQEIAAECLDLPFSTYRRHLTSGIQRCTEWLWRRELHGPHPE
ncbi:MAG: ATP-binding protein [Chloroflexota bacterium]|nr:ATP-binding protein [Chloroflexota bacterium]